MPLANGTTFAGYRIVRLLGSGARGATYEAKHLQLPRRDALKVLTTDVSAQTDYRACFARETDLASRLWHPNIVRVYRRGDDHGHLWTSMGYIHGVDAARLLDAQSLSGLSPRRVTKIVTAVAAALDYAHTRGLPHRNIKPSNIMLTTDEQRILLTDFGIPRSCDDITRWATANMTLDSVAYCAPEQLMRQELDGRADQYSLAATTYHLLSGAPLFPHSEAAAVFGRHLTAAPPALADTHPHLAAFDPVLAIALAKRPENRFRYCRDFARAMTLVSPE